MVMAIMLTGVLPVEPPLHLLMHQLLQSCTTPLQVGQLQALQHQLLQSQASLQASVQQSYPSLGSGSKEFGARAVSSHYHFAAADPVQGLSSGQPLQPPHTHLLSRSTPSLQASYLLQPQPVVSVTSALQSEIAPPLNVPYILPQSVPTPFLSTSSSPCDHNVPSMSDVAHYLSAPTQLQSQPPPLAPDAHAGSASWVQCDACEKWRRLPKEVGLVVGVVVGVRRCG